MCIKKPAATAVGLLAAVLISQTGVLEIMIKNAAAVTNSKSEQLCIKLLLGTFFSFRFLPSVSDRVTRIGPLAKIFIYNPLTLMYNSNF